MMGAVTTTVAFWDTVCERAPALARLVPYAECRAPKSASPLPPAGPSRATDEEIARRIREAKFTLDDAGFIKAFAQGAEEVALFKQLRIMGDEKSLKQALLRYPIGSTEFGQLARFMATSHSEHYAAAVRKDIVDGLRKLRASDLNAAWNVACKKTDSTYFGEFVRFNIAKNCGREAQWPENAAAFASETAMRLGEPAVEQSWRDADDLLFRFRPASARMITPNEIYHLRKQEKGERTGEFLQMVARFTTKDTYYMNGEDKKSLLQIGLWSMTADNPVEYFLSRDETQLRFRRRLSEMRCSDVVVNKKHCSAKFTLRSDRSKGLIIVNIDDVRRLERP